MDPSNVSIVVPAYNEGPVIGAVVKALREAMPQAELIVVNDGSTDDTPAQAQAAGATVISHEMQGGYGWALRTGTLAASRDYVLFCDGDGQHSVEDVARLIAECDGYDMVVGARGADSHVPRRRLLGKFIMQRFARYMAKQDIPDINSGLRVFKRESLRKVLYLMPTGFSFSTTSSFAMIKANRRIKYVPIKTGPRVGKSTVRQLRDGPRALMLMLRLVVLFEPLRVFMAFAGFTLLLAFVSMGIDLTFGRHGIGQTTVTFSIATLVIFTFGLLCDQVSAIRREIHD